MPSLREVDIADYASYAGAVLGMTEIEALRITQVSLAESALAAPFASFGGEIFYSDPVEQAGILCSRIVRNHALPDGNKRVAYLAMRDHLLRRDLDFQGTSQHDRAKAVAMLAGGSLSEVEFIAWLQAEVGPAP